MSRIVRRIPAIAFVVLVSAWSWARADDAPATVSAERYRLDEYNADVWRTPDTAKIGLGLTIGEVLPSEWFWNYGGRLAWVQVQGDDLPLDGGVALGGVVGGGFDPRRTVAPVAQLALDVPFGLDGVSFQASILAGARVRLTTSAEEQLALTFGLYQAQVFGKDGVGDFSDTGIAVLFSTGLFSRR